MQLKEKSLFNEVRDTLERVKKSKGEGFYGYTVTENQSLSRQALFLGMESGEMDSYQNRLSEDSSCRVQIYARHGNPLMMGNSGFTVDPLFPVQSQIEKCFENAGISKNQPWDLVMPPELPYADVRICDPEIEGDLERAAESLKERIQKTIKNLEGVRVNSAELFVNYHSIHTETSTGVVMDKRRGDIYFEVAMEKLPGPNSQEVHRYLRGTALEQIQIEKFIEDTALETRSLGDTIVPGTDENAVILVDGEVVSDFIHALTEQLNADHEYQKLPYMPVGQKIYPAKLFPDADSVSVTMDPFIPMMSESSPFTHEGMPAERAEVIKDGTVAAQIVSNRMGQYLARKSNGICGNFVMQDGSLSKEQLIASVDECIEIISFSSLLINPHTLTWSSEIKLGRLHRKGSSPVMVKGGVASGDIRQNFAGCRFGSEHVVISAVADQWHPAKGYSGPDSMLIRSGVKIAGE